jgi:hypothetical protein
LVYQGLTLSPHLLGPTVAVKVKMETETKARIATIFVSGGPII